MRLRPSLSPPSFNVKHHHTTTRNTKKLSGPRKLHFVLGLAEPVAVGKQSLRALLVSCPEAATLDVPSPSPPPSSGSASASASASAPATATATAEGRLSGPAAVVLCQLFGLLAKIPPRAPEPSLFRSSKGLPHVRATSRVSLGALVPVRGALLFLEAGPCLYLPTRELAAVEVSRAGGASTTFDIICHRKGEEERAPQEFSQIGAPRRRRRSGYRFRGRPLRAAAGSRWHRDR